MVCMIFFMNLLHFILYFSGCPLGFYGLGCLHTCACKNGASCDAVTGQCLCPLGYHGVHCEKGTGAPLMAKPKTELKKLHIITEMVVGSHFFHILSLMNILKH